MILSHRAPSSLNMSSYRPVWTHFNPISILFLKLILQLLASGTCSRQIHHRFATDPQYIHDRCIIIRFLWNPCDKYFRISDLLEPLRQQFQNFGPARTLATKMSKNLDLSKPLRQRFQNFGPVQSLASKISEFWTYHFDMAHIFGGPTIINFGVRCSVALANQNYFPTCSRFGGPSPIILI